MYQGSCLCGAVTFEVTGYFSGFFLCHCSRCRKVTGSAHGANLFSKDATLAWLSGEDSVRAFNLPGTRFVKTFCATCSAALPTKGDGWMLVPAGSLDCDVGMKPAAHVFTASRADWDHELGSVPSFAELPRFP